MQSQVAQSRSSSAERTVEHCMANRSLDWIYEILEAADLLVDIGNPDGKRGELVRRVVEDLTSAMEDLTRKHSATVVLCDIEPHSMRCDACKTPWPCQVYRDIHRSITDDSRCFETVRELMFELRAT